MKYCQMQKQLIGDYTLRRRELREDEIYMESEVTQSKVDKIKLKLALNEEQNKCEAINFANASASETLAEMNQISSTLGGLQSLETSNMYTARISAVNSLDKNKQTADVGQNQWSSQDQTQVTSKYQQVQSAEATEVLDTINTVNFNSKIYNSVQDQEASIMKDQNVNNQGIFGHKGNLSTDVNAEGQALYSPGLTLESQMQDGITQS